MNGLMLFKLPIADPTITMTVAMMTLLLSYNFGVQKLGTFGYLKNYARPLPFFLPINVMEEFTDFLTLSLRLYSSIYAGEVLLTLIGSDLAHSSGIGAIILSAPLTVIWQGFSVLIGSIQAYVFITLSMVYIGKKVTQEWFVFGGYFMKFLAVAIAAGLAALAASYGNGKVISTTIQGMTRQPESASELRSAMFIGIDLIEAVPTLAVVIAFLILFLG